MVKYISLVTKTIASQGLQRGTYDLVKDAEITGLDASTLQYCLIQGLVYKQAVKEDAPENKQHGASENKDDSGSDSNDVGDAHTQSDIDDAKTYTNEELEALPMAQIRAIGKKYNVKDNVKGELIAKILEAQSGATK